MIGCLPTAQHWQTPHTDVLPVPFPPLTQCTLPDRISTLIWDITIAPGAAKAIVDAGARHLADVAAEYSHRVGRDVYLSHLFLSCNSELKQMRNHAACG